MPCIAMIEVMKVCS